MATKFDFGEGAVAVPLSALKHICETTDSTSIRALCLLLSHGGSHRPPEQVGEELVSLGLITEPELKIAMAYLSGAKILTSDSKPSARAEKKAAKPVSPSKNASLATGSEADSLTSDSIKEWMESNNTRREFVKACEDIYGNVFNKTELMTVITYSREYHLRDECILAILGYSRENGYGIAYTKKIFNRMVDNNINTLDTVNAELAFLSEHSAYVTTVKNIFGLTRALTTYEKPKVEKWHKEYKFPRELVQLAFDKAAHKEKASIAYCDRILIGWYEEGLRTADDVKKKFNTDKPKASTKTESTYSLDDFFNAAVERSYKNDKKNDQEA